MSGSACTGRRLDQREEQALRTERIDGRLGARLAIATGAALLLAAASGPARADDAGPGHTAMPAQRLAPGTTAALVPPAAGEIRWTKIAVRAKPSQSAPVIAVFNQFRPDFRLRVVLAIGEHVDMKGKRWLKIAVPGRPNGQRGWVAAAGLSLTPMRREIRIDRSDRQLELWEGEKLLLGARVAVGKPGAETPLGLFYITSKFVPDAPILGAYALETSGYSKLSDWPGGGVVGIHGTPWPWLLGQAVSHGCVRVHNAKILRLRTLAPVGTPIRITA